MRAHLGQDRLGGLHRADAVLAGNDRLAPLLDGLQEARQLAQQRFLFGELHFLHWI